ncbi:MAG: hypothetical protein ACLQNE_35630 [Thermoguttaceae bacterium]
MNLKNLGAGLPDGGLFTADQFQRQADGELPRNKGGGVRLVVHDPE